jgi:hypothetical protein
VAKLVWRVKLVAELEPGVISETELACIERDQQISLAGLGLRLDETKQLTAALQGEMVPAQVAALGRSRRSCEACGCVLVSKGHYGATFRSLFGDVPVRVPRRLACSCQGASSAKSCTVLELGQDALAPEFAYVTARYAALAPFGKVATLLSELLPISRPQHASTVRNRTLRVGKEVVQAHAASASEPARPASGPVVVGLDGGYLRHRHRAEGRRFEVIAGKVIDADGGQHRLAFTRTGPAVTAEAFRAALAVAGVNAKTAATVLCDGDAGLWQLQRKVLPGATMVLDWWHAAVRFEHALQAARSLGRATANGAHLAAIAVRGLERAKWRLWHGRWPGCRRKLAALCHWTERRSVREVAGIDKLRQHAGDLLGYLERNEAALVHYAARRQQGEPIATSFVESAVGEIISWRMNKAQQMRWSRATVPAFLDVRTAVLNDTLENAFRQRHHGFRPANDDCKPTVMAA